MTPDPDPLFRTAGPEDAQAVAGLHADSWRRHYRGAFADSFLDGDVVGHLTRLWSDRLTAASPRAHTVIAECDGELVGLAHTQFDEDPRWGALVDNLHVRHGLKRHGIGTRLLAAAAAAVLDRPASSGLHLWVLAQNSPAQAFYSARGGTPVERAHAPAPGGDPARLNGRPECLRYVWPDPSVLLAG
jgi:GNAT superfamily N-acetyltransferase